MNEMFEEQSPYAEDKAVTWRSLSRTKRIAISAGALAIGAFTIAGPAMPVIAQMVGVVDPNNKHLLDDANANEKPNFPGTPNGIAVPNPNGPLAGSGATDGGLGAIVGAPGGNPNIQAVPPTAVKPQNPTGGTVLPQVPGNLNFGNTSSATPSGGGSGSTGSTTGGKGGWGEREHDGDRERGDRDGDDD